MRWASVARQDRIRQSEARRCRLQKGLKGQRGVATHLTQEDNIPGEQGQEGVSRVSGQQERHAAHQLYTQ